MGLGSVWGCAAAPLAKVTPTQSVSDTGGLATPTFPSTGTTGGSPQPFELQVSTAVQGDVFSVSVNLMPTVDECEEQALAFADLDCADVDEDGFVDVWEDAVIGRLNPAIRFDEAEPLFDDPDAVLANVARLTEVGGDIRVYLMLGYSRDYGRCGISAHDGDSERVAFSLTRTGEAGDVVVTAFYTAAHEGTLTDHGAVFAGTDRAVLTFESDPGSLEPRWVVFSSDGKHATYGSLDLCESAEWAPCLEEDCGPDGVPTAEYTVINPVYNAGEPDAQRLGALDGIGFPGDHAWLDQSFCGGGTGGWGDGCSSSVLSKLTEDPF